MSKPLVSIIIPVYNGAPFIEQIFKNIESYSYKNIEILIGNDFSTDETSSTISKYLERFPNTVFIESDKNIGPGAMRNKLISKAKGTYIAIQDVDDLSTEDRIEKQVDFLEKHKEISIVGSNCELVWDSNKWNQIACPTTPSLKNWILQNSMVHASIMFRREVFQSTKYREDLFIGEDYYFLTGAYFNSFKFHNLDESLYIYNIDPKDLKNRNQKLFLKLINAKLKISTLFPLFLRPVFISLSIVKLVVSVILGLMRNIFSK